MVRFKGKGNKGFTLIELLIVIAVIAVLVAILVPNFKSMRMEAKESKARGDVKNLQTAVIIYINRWNKFPTTNGVNPSMNALLLEPKEYRVVNDIPDDPFRAKGNKYTFDTYLDSLEADATYVIFSYGRDETVDIVPDTHLADDKLVTGSTGETDDDIFVTNAKIE